MNFIYKIRHKKSGLYLKLDNILDDIGSVYTSYPQNIKLNITVHLSYKYEPDSFETKTDDWLIEEFACILHECHQPTELVGVLSDENPNFHIFSTAPQLKIKSSLVTIATGI